MRILRIAVLGVIAVILSGAVLLYWLLYVPASAAPKLSGTVTRGSIEMHGLARSYLMYVPHGIRTGAPLVVALHGSGMDGAELRYETGYGFDRMADARGFALVYPDAFEGYWNGCNIVGDFSANKLDIDDVGFLSALVDKLVAERGLDPARVFAVGVSRGGAMAARLALEAPAHFRAVADVSASVPVQQNFKCRPAGHGTSSVMIMNGTEDTIVPFNGGEVNLFGVFLRRGNVLSARAAAQYFAGLNGIGGAPQTRVTDVADGVRVEQVTWRNGANVEVELVAIHGGGHGMPQPYRRQPRLLGPTPSEPNGPAMIWDFFARQRPR